MALRTKVSSGEQYGDVELSEYWALLQNGPLVLGIASSELSEKSGLSARFFASAVGDKRRPKLANMLKALTGLVEVAAEKLEEYGDSASSDAGAAKWLPNPLLGRPSDIEALQSSITALKDRLLRSNSLSEIPSLDAAWRAELIAQLETLLVLLKAPMIERSLIKRTASTLTFGAKKIADYSLGGLVGGGMMELAMELLKLL